MFKAIFSCWEKVGLKSSRYDLQDRGGLGGWEEFGPICLFKTHLPVIFQVSLKVT